MVRRSCHCVYWFASLVWLEWYIHTVIETLHVFTCKCIRALEKMRQDELDMFLEACRKLDQRIFRITVLRYRPPSHRQQKLNLSSTVYLTELKDQSAYSFDSAFLIPLTTLSKLYCHRIEEYPALCQKLHIRSSICSSFFSAFIPSHVSSTYCIPFPA